MLLNPCTQKETVILQSSDKNGIKSKLNEYFKQHCRKPKSILVSIEIWQKSFSKMWQSNSVMGVHVAPAAGIDTNQIILIL